VDLGLKMMTTIADIMKRFAEPSVTAESTTSSDVVENTTPPRSADTMQNALTRAMVAQLQN
jgi:hypothetical protein